MNDKPLALPIIIEADCIGCLACVIACPYAVLDLDDRNLAVIVNQDACTQFSTCAEVCPTDAIILPWRDSGKGSVAARRGKPDNQAAQSG